MQPPQEPAPAVAHDKGDRMQPEQVSDEQVVASATDILTRRYGGEQSLFEVERLNGSGPSIVLRARVKTNPFFQQRSVIIKQAPPTESVFEEAAYLREVVAYQFATSLSEKTRPGPALLGYDTQQRIIIITDSGNGETLAEALETASEEDHIALLRSLGTALGRMHAGTADEEEAFNVLLHRMTRSRPNAAPLQRLRDRLLSHRIRVGLRIMREAGIEIPQEVVLTARNIERRLLRGGMRAFTPFDLAPDNVIRSGNSFHFLDYESAGFRDVSFDVAYVVARFPVYLASQPFNEEATKAFVDAWRIQVSDLWPGVQHPDTLQARITGALVGWALSSVAMLEPKPMAALLQDDPTFEKELEAAGLSAGDIQDFDLVDGVAEAIGDDAEENAGVVLRPRGGEPLTEDELLVRRDLRETFESLAAYAGSGKDPAYVVVAEFASEVARRLR